MNISNVTALDAEDIFEMASMLSMSFDVAGKHKLSDFLHVIDNKSVIFLIARMDGEAAGYLYGNNHYAFYAAQNIAWIEELFVKKYYRCRGVATALIERAELIAHEHKAALISVATRRAEPFYENCGYEHSANYFRKILKI